jgi:hypothetical protein
MVTLPRERFYGLELARRYLHSLSIRIAGSEESSAYNMISVETRVFWSRNFDFST